MKMNKNILKNTLLSLGSVALVTLPISSIVSCSDNGPNQQNPGGDSGRPGQGNGGSGSSGNNSVDSNNNNNNQPSNRQEYLNHTNTFSYTNERYTRDPDLLLNFDSWREKFKSNKVKIKNDDGSLVKYELTINFDPGLVVVGQNYKSYKREANLEKNDYKKINNPISLKVNFSLVYNDYYDTYNFKDIESNDEQILVSNSDGYASLPLNDTFSIASPKGLYNKPNGVEFDLDKWVFDYFNYSAISFGSISHNSGRIYLSSFNSNRNDIYNKLSNKYTNYESTTSNYWKIGIKGSKKYFGNSRELDCYTNVKGNLTIKPINY